MFGQTIFAAHAADDYGCLLHRGRGFFEQYGKELEEIGLINPKDLYEDSYLKNVGRQMELQRVTRNIIAQNKRWMKPQQEKLATDIEKEEKKYFSFLIGGLFWNKPFSGFLELNNFFST